MACVYFFKLLLFWETVWINMMLYFLEQCCWQQPTHGKGGVTKMPQTAGAQRDPSSNNCHGSASCCHEVPQREQAWCYAQVWCMAHGIGNLFSRYAVENCYKIIFVCHVSVNNILFFSPKVLLRNSTNLRRQELAEKLVLGRRALWTTFTGVEQVLLRAVKHILGHWKPLGKLKDKLDFASSIYLFFLNI